MNILESCVWFLACSAIAAAFVAIGCARVKARGE